MLKKSLHTQLRSRTMRPGDILTYARKGGEGVCAGWRPSWGMGDILPRKSHKVCIVMRSFGCWWLCWCVCVLGACNAVLVLAIPA